MTDCCLTSKLVFIENKIATRSHMSPTATERGVM